MSCDFCWAFLVVPWFCLQFAIMTFSDHIHILYAISQLIIVLFTGAFANLYDVFRLYIFKQRKFCQKVLLSINYSYAIDFTILDSILEKHKIYEPRDFQLCGICDQKGLD